MPFILFIDSASLLIISFLYLKCNILTSCWCCNFYLCLHPLILFSFLGLECKIIRSYSCHQLCLAQRNWKLYIIMLCQATLIEKVSYQVLTEIMSATIDFNFFSFQIRVNNAVGVPVHHSSFGPSPLTCQF